MNIYISGRKTGDYNYREKFLDAEKRLRDAGYNPCNPAALPVPGADWNGAMRAALRLMLESDGVALLPDWQKSKGAKIEARLAREVGIPAKPIEEWKEATGAANGHDVEEKLIEWAERLNAMKIEYPFYLNQDLRNELKRDGIILAYGASDDLLEFEGALNDEVGAWNGTTVRIGRHAYGEGEPFVFDEDENRKKMTFNKAQILRMKKITAIWCPRNEKREVWASWHIVTPDIEPVAWFDIFENGKLFCRGLIIPADLLEAV
jgi:hypothetical protein